MINPVCPWDKPRFSSLFFFAQWKPRDKPGLSLGQTGVEGRQKVHVVNVYVPLLLAIEGTPRQTDGWSIKDRWTPRGQFNRRSYEGHTLADFMGVWSDSNLQGEECFVACSSGAATKAERFCQARRAWNQRDKPSPKRIFVLQKPLTFADSPLLMEIKACSGHRKPQTSSEDAMGGWKKEGGRNLTNDTPPKKWFWTPFVWYVSDHTRVSLLFFPCKKMEDWPDQTLVSRGPEIFWRVRCLVRFPPPIRFAPPHVMAQLPTENQRCSQRVGKSQIGVCPLWSVPLSTPLLWTPLESGGWSRRSRPTLTPSFPPTFFFRPWGLEPYFRHVAILRFFGALSAVAPLSSKWLPVWPKLLQKILFKNNCFGTINFCKDYKTISLQSKFLRIFSCKQGQTSGSSIINKMLWWITKIVVPRNYFVIISARMVHTTSFVLVNYHPHQKIR